MDKKAPVERRTLSVVEAAHYLGVHPDSVYEMVRKKLVPHIRVQTRILFRVESLESWMAEEEKRNLVAQ